MIVLNEYRTRFNIGIQHPDSRTRPWRLRMKHDALILSGSELGNHIVTVFNLKNMATPLEESPSTDDDVKCKYTTGILKATILTKQDNDYNSVNNSATMCIILSGVALNIPIPFALGKKIQMEADGLCYGEGVRVN